MYGLRHSPFSLLQRSVKSIFIQRKRMNSPATTPTQNRACEAIARTSASPYAAAPELAASPTRARLPAPPDRPHVFWLLFKPLLNRLPLVARVLSRGRRPVRRNRGLGGVDPCTSLAEAVTISNCIKLWNISTHKQPKHMRGYGSFLPDRSDASLMQRPVSGLNRQPPSRSMRPDASRLCGCWNA